MLTSQFLAELDASLADDDTLRDSGYPGPSGTRQPTHTVYVAADSVTPDIVEQWGKQALTALDRYGPLPEPLQAETDRVVTKLRAEPIEDLRIDFEDGYGLRSDEEEDDHARTSARALAAMLASGTCPPFFGLRIKSLERSTRRRGVRTLDLFLHTFSECSELPNNFRITLPKVTSVAQIESMVALSVELQRIYRTGMLAFEIQVETPQAILGADGRTLVAPMVHAAAGHCVGLHYGTYDYSASVGVAAPFQSLDHPAADHAKAVMQVAAAGTGISLSDGSTNVLPVGSTADVNAAWQLHGRLVMRSLERGFYQGWDLHPAQLPSRFAATFAFYRAGAHAVADRLRAYLTRAQSGLIDEPATAMAMATYLTRGMDSGALDAGVTELWTGISTAELLTLARRRPPIPATFPPRSHR